MLSNDELIETVQRHLAEGTSRKDTYNKLLPDVLSEQALAQAIAFHIWPEHYARHKNKMDWLMVIMGIQVIIGFLGIAAITKSVIFTLIFTALMLGLTYGIYKLKPWAFFIFFILGIQSALSNFKALKEDPIAAGIGLAIILSCTVYAFYVKQSFLPYMMPLGRSIMRGKKEKYAFLEE